LGPVINSVSIVPVGLTKHRDNLYPLKPYNKELALKLINQVERFAKLSYIKHRRRVFYCSDELYILAGLKLPSYRYYEDFPQLENGVGMMRLFMSEFREKARELDSLKTISISPFSIATGSLAADYIEKLLHVLNKWYDIIPGTVYPIINDFFGESVTVSGLITGCDILAQLKDKYLGFRLLIPRNMLRSEGDVFLDDMTVGELSEALNVPIRVVNINGVDFFDAVFE